MLTREFIIETYQNVVKNCGGRVVGLRVFERKTGISAAYWWGGYWRSWTEFQADAGFEPNRRPPRHTEEFLVRRFVELAMEMGKLPTHADMRIRSRQDPSFPSPSAFTRRTRYDVMLRKVADYCEGKPELAALVEWVEQRRGWVIARRSKPGRAQGIVYMLREKDCFLYTLRKARGCGARFRRSAARLSCRPETVHVIDTDDPEGIERYWRQRFKSKLLPGGRYRLLPDDLGAFRKRKFQ